MNHAVGLGGRRRQTVEVVKIAAPDLGAHRSNCPRRSVGAGEAYDLMAVVEQLGDDGGGDVA